MILPEDQQELDELLNEDDWKPDPIDVLYEQHLDREMMHMIELKEEQEGKYKFKE